MKLGSILRTLALPAAVALAPACAVEGTPMVGGYATVGVASVPPDIYAYPHVWYGGQYVYLVGDRWYSPYGRGWVALRGEPPALQRYRLSYRARPAPPGRGYRPEPHYGYPREPR